MSGPLRSSSATRRRLTRPGIALALPLLIAAVTSCSADADPSSGGGAPVSSAASAAPTQSDDSGAPAGSDAESSPMQLQVTEVDFAIEVPETELESGSFTLEVRNEGGASHDLVIEDADGTDVAATEIISPGESATLEVDLAPGEYVFYCSVGNHRGMGMELTVTVS